MVRGVHQGPRRSAENGVMRRETYDHAKRAKDDEGTTNHGVDDVILKRWLYERSDWGVGEKRQRREHEHLAQVQISWERA